MLETSSVRGSLSRHNRAFAHGFFEGPQTFRASDAPQYTPAEIAIILCFGVSMLDLVFIAWYCRRENKRKARLRAEPSYQKIRNAEWLDLTDWENLEYVYVY